LPVALGAVDLGVKPKKAQVYVDGRYVGLVKHFDGYPNYLWIGQGTHSLTFYHPGYQNLVRAIVVDSGHVLKLKESMVAGEAVLPPPPPEASAVAQAPAAPASVSAPSRVAEGGGSAVTAANDARADPARMSLVVMPEDASIYLDGRFLGSAREISNLRAPLIIDAGEHLLQVVHPDYSTQKREFAADEGEEVSLEVDLGSDGGG